MTNLKIVAVCFVVGLAFSGATQKEGYFGKNNILGIHGTWFLRSVPQVFYSEKIYGYREVSDEFVSGFFRNHNWSAGLSYKRIYNENSAVGFQLDLGTRNLGSPNFDLSSRTTFINPWENELHQNTVWSASDEKFLNLNEMVLSRTNIINRQAFLTWSRSKTATVMPLGLMSTFGLGVQHTSLNSSQSIYAKSYFSESLNMPWSNEQAIFRTSNPNSVKNEYLGIVWMWDLSLNYAVSKNWLFTLGSDIRGVAHVFSLTKEAAVLEAFPLSQQGVPTIEGVLYGRNLKKEIRKEMIFQNTFRVGMLFMF